MKSPAPRTLIQKNIFIFKTLVLLRVTAHVLRHYIFLPFGDAKHFKFFAWIYASRFGTKMLRLSPLIPYAQPEELYPGIGSVLIQTIGQFRSFNTLEVSGENGSLISAHELQVLCALVKKQKPVTIFEIGTHRGWTISNLALNAPPGCRIMSLDIARLNPDNAEIQKIFEKYSIQFIQADSTSFDFSRFYQSIDFIFLDGSHAEADIERDTQAALKMISPNGIIVWHDHNLKFPGVINCLHRISGQIKIRHIPGTALAIYNRGI